ncbi:MULTISPECIES: YbhN family protein [unclassified Kitasatospora]|uniref:lysylphosphatidylglycerol synthase transmembrane domain-containing protein n=1 Tax=unclassified Kitasatospora TaxID=2633591 RepID=UPI0033F17B38
MAPQPPGNPERRATARRHAHPSIESRRAGPGRRREAATATATLAPALIVLTMTVLAAVGLTRSPGLRRAALRWWQRAGDQSPRVRGVEESLAHLVTQARTLQPGLRPWLRPLGLALLNWGFDAVCLACCLWALGIGVPWRGFLAVYGLTQVSTSLRLTPGSLGIAEASLTGLLVLYGLRADQALAVSLLYRIISYWAMQPIGWGSWLGVTLAARPAPDRPTQ